MGDTTNPHYSTVWMDNVNLGPTHFQVRKNLDGAKVKRLVLPSQMMSGAPQEDLVPVMEATVTRDDDLSVHHWTAEGPTSADLPLHFALEFPTRAWKAWIPAETWTTAQTRETQPSLANVPAAEPPRPWCWKIPRNTES